MTNENKLCPRCERGDHSAHDDPTGPMPNGCLWCPCGHQDDCPCAGCEWERDTYRKPDIYDSQKK